MKTRQLLPAILVVVLATDLVGGIGDVAANRSSWTSAWGPDATLCAPVPMIVFQIVTVLIATRANGKASRIAAGLLAAACFVSILSGFFDGQLGRSDLAPGEVAFQAWLLVVTGVLGAVAVLVAAAVPIGAAEGAATTPTPSPLREGIAAGSRPPGDDLAQSENHATADFP